MGQTMPASVRKPFVLQHIVTISIDNLELEQYTQVRRTNIWKTQDICTDRNVCKLVNYVRFHLRGAYAESICLELYGKRPKCKGPL